METGPGKGCEGGEPPDLQGVLKAAEVLDLGAEQQVAQLREGQEDDHEHDPEACQVLGTATQGGGQLRHGLVEADVLEDLQPNQRCDSAVVLFCC